MNNNNIVDNQKELAWISSGDCDVVDAAAALVAFSIASCLTIFFNICLPKSSNIQSAKKYLHGKDHTKDSSRNIEKKS